MKRTITIGLLALAVAAFLVSNASRATSQEGSKPPRFRVGYVNILRIMTELPEYKELSAEYLKDRQSLFSDLKGKQGKKAQAYLTKNQDKIKASVEKWNKAKEQFITGTLEKIRKASDSVAKDKKLNFVLMDAPWNPLGQNGAVDVTSDVLLHMQQPIQ